MEKKFEKTISELSKVKGFEELLLGGAKLYLVGGCVRDIIMDREPKDIDILAVGIELDELADMLSRTGTVDVVGKSFAVVKYKRDGVTYDVAVPRTDSHVEDGGHKDVIVSTMGVTLETDLERRDFTMNAIAVSFDGVVIDPYNGMRDIEERTVRMVDEHAFAMDPLRMVRAVCFAARFDFDIETNTAASIIENRKRIHKIPGERLHDEFMKVFNASIDPYRLVVKLDEVWLMREIFECYPSFEFDEYINNVIPVVKGDFFFVMLLSCMNMNKEWSDTLRGDNNTLSELIGLQKAHCDLEEGSVFVLQKILEKCPSLIESSVLAHMHPLEMKKFKSGSLPWKRSQLDINGDALLIWGIPHPKMGEAFEYLMREVLRGNVKNELQYLYAKVKHFRINN